MIVYHQPRSFFWGPIFSINPMDERPGMNLRVALGAPAATLEQARAWLTSPRLLDQLVGHMVQTSTHSEAAAAVSRIVNGFCRGILA
jgi:hypothetical protein